MGAIDNIYSSLVVRLALGGRFGRVRLWKDCAEYEQAGQGVCGLRKVDRRSGLAHLDLLFSEQTSSETRNLFIAFVEEHLQKEGVTIKEVLEVTCVCGFKFQETSVHKHISEGHADIGCPECENRNRISEGARKTRESNPQVEKELLALKSVIERKTKKDMDEAQCALKPIEVFLSYSHRDEGLRHELDKHLSGLRRAGVISAWHDRMIDAGKEWEREIDSHLESASVILLLVSADFIASEYCYDKEMKRALQRHAAGEARVVPVILRPSDWQGLPFSKLQALPEKGRPVTSWPNRDKALANVAQGVRRMVEELLRPAPDAKPKVEAMETVSERMLIIEPTPIRILHLSDLHFGKDDDPVAKLQPLVRDLKDREDGLGFEHLDYLVVSSDLTNRASAEEFERTYSFISELIKSFELSAARCVIVPGNHDLSWDQEVYDWKPKRKVDLNKLKPGSYVEQGDGFLIREDEKYPARFENFRKFYHELMQQPYPTKVGQQCIPFFV
jgi:hypothetical protein